MGWTLHSSLLLQQAVFLLGRAGALQHGSKMVATVTSLSKRPPPSCRPCFVASASVGLIMAAGGAALAFYWPTIFELLLNRELTLTPHSTSFPVWRDTPVPMVLDFYFWNWTNPEDIRDLTTKPNLVQMGPYRFNEVHEKVNITWHENNTVSYRQIRRWYFDAEGSNGTLEDQVTTLNVVALTAAFVVRDWNYVMKMSFSVTMSAMGQDIHITKKVGQLLFEGYDSPLISMAATMPALSGLDIPYDKFGWFYMRNGSADFDGVFNMRTGADDVSRLGELARWNYDSRTRFFPGHCGLVRGSAGELWPPRRSRSDRIGLFSSDLCRSIELEFSEETEVSGVSGLRFSGGAALLDNGTLFAENECYCAGECVSSGVLNVSSCRYGAPAFVSYPHFFLGDQSLRDAVNGMEPHQDKHRFYVSLEPETGIPLDVAARFQINILLRPYRGIRMLQGVPKMLFPVMWFEERATITDELATPLSYLLMLQKAGLAVSFSMCAGGLLILIGLGLSAVVGRSRYSSVPTKEEMVDTVLPMKEPAMKLVDTSGIDATMTC